MNDRWFQTRNPKDRVLVPLGRAILLSLLGGLFLFAPVAPARTTAAKLEQARIHYEKAKAAHTTLERTPLEHRAKTEYDLVIEAFRRVYLTAPTYGNSTICLMVIGELSEVVARRWALPEYFQAAMESYEFLLKEYPHSQFRFDALLAIARIYREDLRQPEQALQQYERYLSTYPRSAQARQVQQAIAQLRDELGSQGTKTATASAPAAASAPVVKKAAESELSEKSDFSGKSEDSAESTKSVPPPRPAKVAIVSDIRYWATPVYSRVVVDVEEKVKYEVGRLSSPDRLYVDLYDTKVRPVAGRTIPVSGELLKRVRLAQYQAAVSRVVLDLGEMTTYTVSELFNPYRLVIDIKGASAEAAASAGSATAPEKSAQAQAVLSPNASPIPSPLPSQGPAQPAAPKTEAETREVAKAVPSVPAPNNTKPAQPIRGGAHSLTRALGLKIGRILLDPGHGGHDTGTIGPGGYTEKELVLDLAQRLGKLIEEQLGSEVVYTRGEDTFVSLESRAALANKAQADLFLSIHANSSRIRRASGIETYYLNFTSDPEALEVAARENAGSQETISELQGLVRKIALQEKLDESKEFATRVHSSLRKTLAGGKSRQFDRGVKKAPFVVLIGANMPAVLAEVSFLSNPEEEKRLRTPEYRQKIAEALFAGIAGYAETMSGVKPARSGPTQTASLE